METVYRRACLLLIITMCGLEVAYTSTTGDKEPFSRQLDKFQIQKGRFTRSRTCQWDQGDKSVMCRDMHLKRVPRELHHNTLILNLAYNEISIIVNNSFEPYPNLVSLDLKRNGLKTIESAAFRPLKHLKSLDLSYNDNHIITSSVPFRPLDALVELNIDWCKLTNLPNDLIGSFPNLRYLTLGGNHLSSLNVSRCKTARLDRVLLTTNKFRDLTPDTFTLVCPTKELWLVNNPIGYISEDAIAALPVGQLTLGHEFAPTASLFLNLTRGIARSTIEWLFLADMELSDGIPFGIFRPLHEYPLLYGLMIYQSGHLSLIKNIFIGLNCPTLILDGNSFHKVEPEYFLGMSRLKKLLLYNNQIMHFNPYNTTWESNMTILNLSGNELYELFGYQLHGLSNLKLLNISLNSHLLFVDLGSYDWSESLEVLDVTGTSLTNLFLPSSLSEFYFADLISPSPYTIRPGQMFNNTNQLKIIDISSTELNRGNLWNSYVSRSLFGGLIDLCVLHLSNNPLGNFPDRVFKDNSLLAYLMMNNCEISSLTGTIFQGLDSLVYLDLNGNNLLLISTNALKNLPVLETLSINDNTIMFVEEGAMENVPHLKNLRMSNNLLVAFNGSTWNTLMNYDLDYIDVSGNPFACRCNYDWLHNLANSSGMFRNQNETLCSVDSLSQLQGKPLLEFDPSKYCVLNIALMSTLPFVALALLIGLLLAFHNRWLIKYKLFLVKLAVIGYRELRDVREHDEFVFDLNIMFTEEDEMWAREHLRHTLEERLPDYNRYSFGDEDLTLGMHYMEAVHYAVDHSFKTILLLSRRAVRDNWFLIKFRTAMDHVHDEQTENTVVIFLEDIPEDEIPYLVRLYLSDRRPYMKWPEDVRGREYFWKELTKLVTVNLKYNPLIPPE